MKEVLFKFCQSNEAEVYSPEILTSIHTTKVPCTVIYNMFYTYLVVHTMCFVYLVLCNHRGKCSICYSTPRVMYAHNNIKFELTNSKHCMLKTCGIHEICMTQTQHFNIFVVFFWKKVALQLHCTDYIISFPLT